VGSVEGGVVWAWREVGGVTLVGGRVVYVGGGTGYGGLCGR
jgi:hypothetical protein